MIPQYERKFEDKRKGQTGEHPARRRSDRKPERRFAVRGWMIAGALFLLSVLAIVGRLAGWW